MPIQQLPNGRWRVQLRRKGLPKFDKVFSSQAEARAAEQQQLALPSQVFVGLDLTVRDLWERYSTSIEFKQKAQNTQNTETTRIKPVLAELGDYALKHLESSPVLVYDFIDKRAASVSERTGKPLSPTSLRLEIAALSAICIWAKRRRMIRENFVRLISRPGQASRKRRVGVKEQAGINDALMHENPRVREAARFSRLIRLLGCRPGELAELRCVDIDYKASSVIATPRRLAQITWRVCCCSMA
jgi:integrase